MQVLLTLLIITDEHQLRNGGFEEVQKRHIISCLDLARFVNDDSFNRDYLSEYGELWIRHHAQRAEYDLGSPELVFGVQRSLRELIGDDNIGLDLLV